jgi:PhnB protein
MNPYLTFNGQCSAAFEFYQKCLGGEIVRMLTYGGSPMAAQTPPAWHSKVLHATFAWNGHTLGGVDPLPEQYKAPQGFAVVLDPSDAAEAERIFASLAEGGTIQMPLQQTFWALRFGILTDQFGIPWVINCGAS